MAPWPPAESSGPAPGRADLTSRWVLLLAAAFGLAVGGSALAEGIDLLPPIEAKFDARFSPQRLSRSEQTPLSPQVSMSFKKADGTHPSALNEFEIEEDRHLRLNLTGVPACHGFGLQDGIPIQQACRGALIGTGRMVVNIKFPEQEPIVTRSKVTVYNDGGKSGSRHLLLATYVTVPTPANIVTTVKVEKSAGGPYGLKLVGSVPKIAGGSGSVTYLGFRFDKEIFSATCPADRNLDTRFTAAFADGTHLLGTVLRNCVPIP